ncbi:hypothetical protein AFEL58S_02076 [Afipia felis]
MSAARANPALPASLAPAAIVAAITDAFRLARKAGRSIEEARQEADEVARRAATLLHAKAGGA